MLELVRVSKSLGHRVVLQSVSFAVAKGEVVFVLGRSGVGKSVLLKTIVGLIPQDSGEIWVGGIKTDPLSEEAMGVIRRQCGLVFQMPALLDSLTVEENLRLGIRDRKVSTEDLAHWLEEIQAPLKILGRKPAQLSLGIQKKISVLRTLLMEPSFILFDEPTTGLDPIATNIMNDVMGRCLKKSGAGCLVVSHDISSALLLADKILLLEDGQIVFQGSPKEFTCSPLKLAQDFMKGSVHWNDKN